ncbi:hypothetical protein pb186bvf_009810 [Paramecium bursaria]
MIFTFFHKALQADKRQKRKGTMKKDSPRIRTQQQFPETETQEPPDEVYVDNTNRMIERYQIVEKYSKKSGQKQFYFVDLLQKEQIRQNRTFTQNDEQHDAGAEFSDEEKIEQIDDLFKDSVDEIQRQLH